MISVEILQRCKVFMVIPLMQNASACNVTVLQHECVYNVLEVGNLVI